jgi:hypothetical protein
MTPAPTSQRDPDGLSQLAPELREVMRRALTGLHAHRDQAVLVGGLAKFFYPAHADFQLPPVRPRATVDLDLALMRGPGGGAANSTSASSMPASCRM